MVDSNTSVKTADDPEELLSFAAVTREFGLSEGALRSAIQRKRLTVNREGLNLRIKRGDLKQYLKNKYMR